MPADDEAREIARGLTRAQRHVLDFIQAQAGQAYSVSIADECGTALGWAYTTTDRLERLGLVSSQLGGRTRERGWKPKRLFAVTTLGLRVRAALEAMEKEKNDGV